MKTLALTAALASLVTAVAAEQSEPSISIEVTAARCAAGLGESLHLTKSNLSKIEKAVRRELPESGRAAYVAELNSVAKSCAEAVLGEGAVFQPDLGKFMLPADANAERQVLAAAQTRAALQAALELQRQERIQAVNNRVFEACVKLAKRDEVAAFTNSLCVSSFKANALPEDN